MADGRFESLPPGIETHRELPDIGLFLRFVKMEGEFYFRYSTSIRDKMLHLELFKEDISEKYSEVVEAKERLEKDGSIEGYELIHIVAYYEAYLGAIYSLLEKIAEISQRLWSGYNLSPRFNKQRKSEDLPEKYADLLEQMDWYEEVHGMRTESTHFLTGMVTLGEDGPGYWNKPNSNRNGALEEIEVPNVMEHVRELHDGVDSFMERYGELALEELEQAQKIHLPLATVDGSICSIAISLEELRLGEVGECVPTEFDCPYSDDCPAREDPL